MNKINSKNGITLIELVMVMVIVATLVGFLSFYVKETVDLWNFVTFRNEIGAQARTAMMRMVREIRQTGNQLPAAITAANTNSLTFTDINSNSISYSLSGGNLMRGSDVLASNATALNFAYYNPTNAQLTSVPLSAGDMANVRRITIQLQISSGGQSITLNSEAFLRDFY
jgi:prepilin-type N-terminal cleavage/methylation domain-containing protein